MASTTRLWKGEATAIKQIDRLTIAGTQSATRSIVTKLRLEDSSQVTVQTTCATSVAGSVTAHLAALQASVTYPFTGVAWTSTSASTIKGTASSAGVPFYVTATTVGAAVTNTRAAVTANSGENDFNTAANWTTSTGGAAVPTASDVVLFAYGSSSVLYGLPQATRTSLSLREIRRSASYTGVLGDPVNGYYLALSATSGGKRRVVIDGSGGDSWLAVSASSVYVIGSTPSSNAVRLKGGTMLKVNVLDSRVVGTVTIVDSSTCSSVYVTARAAKVNIGASVTGMILIEQAQGNVVSKSGKSTLVWNIAAGTGEYHQAATTGLSAANVRGGEMRYNGAGTLTTCNVYSGTMDFRKNQNAAVTVTNATIWGGLLTDRGGLRNITYTNSIIQHGGSIESDTGVVVAYT